MEQAPWFDDIADAPDGLAYWLQANDGVRLRTIVWPKDDAKGTVFIFPGRTEYAEKYGRVASDLAARGFASLAVDWRGQGLAERVHRDPMAGHVKRFSDYQLDVEQVIQLAHSLDMPKPWMMLAHSMGGCIGLRTLMWEYPFDAVSFTGPMWGVELTLPMRLAAASLSSLSKMAGFPGAYAPGRSGGSYVLDADFADNLLTTDRGMWEWMQGQLRAHPELALSGPTLGWLYEALTETARLSRMTSPIVPCLTLCGTDEAIVDVARIKSRMEKWPDGELVMLPGLRHEPLMEGAETHGPLIDRLCEFYLRVT